MKSYTEYSTSIRYNKHTLISCQPYTQHFHFPATITQCHHLENDQTLEKTSKQHSQLFDLRAAGAYCVTTRADTVSNRSVLRSGIL